MLSKAKADTKTRYTEARIHPTLLSRVLERAPSPQVRRAWLHGLPVNDAPHRVRLVKSRAANEKERDHRWCPWPRPLQDYDIHRAESEQWWEECAWELEHEGKSTAE